MSNWPRYYCETCDEFGDLHDLVSSPDAPRLHALMALRQSIARIAEVHSLNLEGVDIGFLIQHERCPFIFVVDEYRERQYRPGAGRYPQDWPKLLRREGG